MGGLAYSSGDFSTIDVGDYLTNPHWRRRAPAATSARQFWLLPDLGLHSLLCISICFGFGLQHTLRAGCRGRQTARRGGDRVMGRTSTIGMHLNRTSISTRCWGLGLSLKLSHNVSRSDRGFYELRLSKEPRPFAFQELELR